MGRRRRGTRPPMPLAEDQSAGVMYAASSWGGDPARARATQPQSVFARRSVVASGPGPTAASPPLARKARLASTSPRGATIGAARTKWGQGEAKKGQLQQMRLDCSRAEDGIAVRSSCSRFLGRCRLPSIGRQAPCALLGTDACPLLPTSSAYQRTLQALVLGVTTHQRPCAVPGTALAPPGSSGPTYPHTRSRYALGRCAADPIGQPWQFLCPLGRTGLSQTERSRPGSCHPSCVLRQGQPKATLDTK